MLYEISGSKPSQLKSFVEEELIGKAHMSLFECQLREYSIFVCKLPEGYAYINRLDQPGKYSELLAAFHNAIVPLSALNKPSDAHGLMDCDCIRTDGRMLTACFPQSELGTLDPSRFEAAYALDEGIQLSAMQEFKWYKATRRLASHTIRVAICVPADYEVRIRGENMHLNEHVEDPKYGDVLVFARHASGGPWYTKPYTTFHNGSFSMMYTAVGNHTEYDKVIMSYKDASMSSPTIEILDEVLMRLKAYS